MPSGDKIEKTKSVALFTYIEPDSYINAISDTMFKSYPKYNITDNIGERVAEDLTIKELLNRFLETLPKEMRNVFVRRYWYMNSIQEIAEGYGISEGKVTVLLFRARRKLKDMLEKEGIYL